MSDLVVTCPRHFFREWIAEGDAAGDEYEGGSWAWYTGRGTWGDQKFRPPIEPGERLYVVAWGMLRGYAPVVDVRIIDGKWAIIREGGAVAVTIDEPIRGFQGWRKVWWPRSAERPFLEWRRAGVPA